MPRSSPGAWAALVVLVAPALLVAPAAAAGAPAGDAPVPSVVIEGTGFGHGAGLAQDGALAMASEGASAAAILAHFYPGTSVARRAAMVRVGVYDAQGPLTLVFPGGGEVRDAPSGAQSPGFPVAVAAGGSVSLSFDGARYKASPLSGATLTGSAAPAPVAVPAVGLTTLPPSTTPTTSFLDPLLQALAPTTVAPAAPPRTAPSAGAAVTPAPNAVLTSRGLWAVPGGDAVTALPGVGRSYRGTLVAAGVGRGLQLTDELDVEVYLRGMGEMPASWPSAALQAQAVAARTFAIRAASAGRTLCDDQQCQVYIGAGNESSANNAAVAATKGQVLTYQGSLAETVYSASGGGIAATAEEAFGPDSPDLPYLRPEPYPTADPQPWATSLPLRQLGARFGYQGELRNVRVSRTGPSGRPLEITFDGDNGPLAVDAHRFWSVLELRSSLFRVRLDNDPSAGDALGAGLPDVPMLGRPRTDQLVARQLPATPLGRAPWVGLALLLLVVWATAAARAGPLGRSPTRPGADPPSSSPTN